MPLWDFSSYADHRRNSYEVHDHAFWEQVGGHLRIATDMATGRQPLPPVLAVIVQTVSGLSLKEINDINDRFSGYVSGSDARADAAQTVRTAVDGRAHGDAQSQSPDHLAIKSANSYIKSGTNSSYGYSHANEGTVGKFNLS